jgi:hypothetical protein
MPGLLHGSIYVDAGGKTLDEQGPEHAGRVSGTDCAAIVERELAQVEGGDGPEDEMNPMTGGSHGLGSGGSNNGELRSMGTKRVAMPFSYAQPHSCSNGRLKIAFPKSSRLLGPFP